MSKVSPSAMGRLLEEISWEGNARKYRHGGRGLENVLTAEFFLALDFPVSLGVFPVTWLVPPAGGGALRDLTNFWWPLLYHGLVGTGWWYIVGWAIERKVRRRASAAGDGEETGR